MKGERGEMTDREKLILMIEEKDEHLWGLEDDDIFGIDYHNFGELADHLLANGVTFQKWIPVTERLPEKDGKFLAHRIICNRVPIMSVVGFARNGKNAS